MFKKDKGFTLIELLVVIAIIGTLSGIVLVSLGDARTKAAEAARKATLRQIVTAQQMIYNDNMTYFFTDVATDGIPALENDATPAVEYFPATGLGEGLYTWEVNTTCDNAFCVWTALTTTGGHFVASEKGAREFASGDFTEPISDGCSCY